MSVRGQSACVHKDLNNSSELFELVMPDHLRFYSIRKLNPCEDGVLQSQCTVTSSLSHPAGYLYICIHISQLDCSQGQVNAMYFDWSTSFDYEPHTSLWHLPSAYSLSDGYGCWLSSCRTTAIFLTSNPWRSIDTLGSAVSVFVKDISLGHSCLTLWRRNYYFF